MPAVYSPIGGTEPSLDHDNGPDYDMESLDKYGRPRSRANSTDGDSVLKYRNAISTSPSLQPQSTTTHPQPPRLGSQAPLIHGAASQSHTYTFERYMYRSTLNTLGPAVVTAFYLFIVGIYLTNPGENDIIPEYPLSAKKIFFAWLILSIFVLDWAKSGLAGFEAAALMKPHFAPSNAMQLMWHTDRGWGSISGWWKALVALWSLLRHKLTMQKHKHDWKGPSTLWWYLSLSSFILYVGIPLAGLSMNPNDGFKLTDRAITILGANETTFDARASNEVAGQASSRWRQGNPTTPQGATIFYAPEGTKNVSETYFEDCIQGQFHGNSSDECATGGTISFFSGPEVTERAHGHAWGFLTNLSCSVTNPKDLKLIQLQGINDWKTKEGLRSEDYGTTQESLLNQWRTSGEFNGFFYADSFVSVDFQYLMATDGDIIGGDDYTNATTLPVPGTLELVFWQSYSNATIPDATFNNLSSHPAVMSSTSTIFPWNSSSFLGFGVHCSSTTDVGTADLNAATRTYSNFNSSPAEVFKGFPPSGVIDQFPGIVSMQTLVFAAFTTVFVEYINAPMCLPGTSGTCSPWLLANLATSAYPAYVAADASNPQERNLQFPTITPERMTLAVQKLFGEMAVALMAGSAGPWVGGLKGLDPATGLVSGVIPWIVVLPLLCVWSLITIVPNLFTFAQRRWAATLDGFEMFRLGAEWRDVVWQFDGAEVKENERVLRGVPGMLGDMGGLGGEQGGTGGLGSGMGRKGFVGLSNKVAEREGVFGWDRRDLG